MSKDVTLILDNSKESLNINRFINGEKRKLTTVYVGGDDNFSGPVIIADGVAYKGENSIKRFVKQTKIAKKKY